MDVSTNLFAEPREASAIHWLTVVIDNLLNIPHDLGIPPLGNVGLVVD
jgi:hypothetical protein